MTVVAFYLPQFYPSPENDEWWGTGYTEWTLVKRAIPLYRQHRQPRVPGELGYYDLRQRSVRDRQATLAKTYGVDVFCYWYYWSNGRRLLSMLIDDIIESGSPDTPFMLGWSNATWADVSERGGGRILLEQKYGGIQDAKAQFEWLLQAFRNERYLKVDGLPALLVYRPQSLPLLYLDGWRVWARAAGFPGLHIIGYSEGPWDPTTNGYDAVVHCALGKRALARPTGPVRVRYRDLPHKLMIDAARREGVYPCVVSNWDHTPRSGRYGTVVTCATPKEFGKLVRRATRLLAAKPKIHRIMFIKSWNEWSEGNYIEPDSLHGRGYLEAILQATRAEGSG